MIARNTYLRYANFESFGNSLYTIFIFLTLENWAPIFYEYIVNYEDTGTTFYFIFLTFVISTIMFKFLLSLIINNFVESSEKIEKMKKY